MIKQISIHVNYKFLQMPIQSTQKILCKINIYYRTHPKALSIK